MGMCERAFLQLHVGMQVDLGCFGRLVTEPECDYGQVHSTSQQIHGGRVPKRMRRNAFRPE